KKAESVEESKEPRSVLWSTGMGGVLPHGNYPALAALSFAYRCRKPANVDLLLDVLSDHVETPEHSVVWRALVHEFDVLGAASDRLKALAFLEQLFKEFPEVLAGFEGTVFLARSARWLPEELLRRWIIAVAASDWPWREQAIGELAMLRVLLDPGD